jgi:hypothetical protein
MKNGKAKQLQPIFIVTACEPYAPGRLQRRLADITGSSLPGGYQMATKQSRSVMKSSKCIHDDRLTWHKGVFAAVSSR